MRREWVTQVYRGKLKENGEMVAVKLSQSTEDDVGSFCQCRSYMLPEDGEAVKSFDTGNSNVAWIFSG
jgi:hypothetical protein